jgi:hypothetical protein
MEPRPAIRVQYDPRLDFQSLAVNRPTTRRNQSRFGGADLPDLFRRAAGYVDRIIKATRLATCRSSSPIKFEFVLT